MTTESQVIVYDSRGPEKFVDEARKHLGDIQTVKRALPVGDYLVDSVPFERKEPKTGGVSEEA